MKRRAMIKGLAATVTTGWVCGAEARSQVSPRDLVPVWMGEQMARRMIELIKAHENPEDRHAMIRVFEHALDGANQPEP